MKEAVIRKKFIDIAKKNGWLYYYPPRSMWQNKDIFEIGDVLIYRDKELALIQLTTKSNLSARRNKIHKIIQEMAKPFIVPVEVWAYDKKLKQFKVEVVN